MTKDLHGKRFEIHENILMGHAILAEDMYENIVKNEMVLENDD